MRKYSVLSLIAIVFFGVSSVFPQSPEAPIKPTYVPGDVVSVSDDKLVIKTKDSQVEITLSPKTEFKRVSAERPSIAAAEPSTRSDISVGDKVIVSVVYGEDKTKLPARTVYLMTKSSIAQRNVKDAERWTTKGISGKVATVNLATRQIGVEVRGLMGTTTTVVTMKDYGIFKRYAPNSVKYSEAVSSSLSEIKPGDMLRATGDKSTDGLSFSAEEVVSGAFQTLAGTVKSIDTAKNEIVITNLQTNKDVIIALATASTMKKFPEEFAQRMLQPEGAGAPGAGVGQRPGGPPVGQPVQRPASDGQGSGGPGRAMMGGRGGGIDEMLERFPTISAADLKVGDMVAVSSSRNDSADKISAIKLLAGVEPFIRAAQASGNMQRGRGAGDFNIPGLDGFDSP